MPKAIKILLCVASLIVIVASTLGLINEYGEFRDRQAQRACWYFDRPHYAIVEGEIWCSLHYEGTDHMDTLENIKMWYDMPNYTPKPIQ